MRKLWLPLVLAALAMAFMLPNCVAASTPDSSVGVSAAVSTFNTSVLGWGVGYRGAEAVLADIQASWRPAENEGWNKNHPKDKHRGDDQFNKPHDNHQDHGSGGKNQFHGAEMSTTGIVMAAALALAAYILFARRRTHKRA